MDESGSVSFGAVLAQMAELGVVASVQPVFDALWGGPGGMYEQRLGRERAMQVRASGGGQGWRRGTGS